MLVPPPCRIPIYGMYIISNNIKVWYISNLCISNLCLTMACASMYGLELISPHPTPPHLYLSNHQKRGEGEPQGSLTVSVYVYGDRERITRPFSPSHPTCAHASLYDIFLAHVNNNKDRDRQTERERERRRRRSKEVHDTTKRSMINRRRYNEGVSINEDETC